MGKKKKKMGNFHVIVQVITWIGKIFIFFAKIIGYVGWIIETIMGLSIDRLGYAASMHPILTVLTVVLLTAVCVVSLFFIVKGIKAFIMSGILVFIGVMLLIIAGFYITRYWVTTTEILDMSMHKD